MKKIFIILLLLGTTIQYSLAEHFILHKERVEKIDQIIMLLKYIKRPDEKLMFDREHLLGTAHRKLSELQDDVKKSISKKKERWKIDIEEISKKAAEETNKSLEDEVSLLKGRLDLLEIEIEKLRLEKLAEEL